MKTTMLGRMAVSILSLATVLTVFFGGVAHAQQKKPNIPPSPAPACPPSTCHLKKSAEDRTGIGLYPAGFSMMVMGGRR